MALQQTPTVLRFDCRGRDRAPHRCPSRSAAPPTAARPRPTARRRDAADMITRRIAEGSKPAGFSTRVRFPKGIWHTDVLPRRVTYLPFVFRTILTGNLRETRLAVLRGRWRRLRGTWSRVHVVIDALTGQTPPVEGEPTFPSPAAERTDGETAAFRSTQRLLHFFVIGLLRRITQRS